MNSSSQLLIKNTYIFLKYLESMGLNALIMQIFQVLRDMGFVAHACVRSDAVVSKPFTA